MKIRSLAVATLFLGGNLVMAQQMCPSPTGSVCLVPSSTVRSSQATTYVMPTPMASTTMVPYSTGMVPYSTGMVSAVPYCGVQSTSLTPVMVAPMYGTTAIGPTYGTPSYQMGNISPDAAFIANQIAALRGDVHSLQGTVQATALQMRGEQLVSQMNNLMADETLFRQQISANPNLPGAQATANSLTLRAAQLNRDLISFNTQMTLIPADQRQFIAPQLQTFTTAVWDPAQQQFALYRTQFIQSASVYQPVFASDPWLQPWWANYQSSLNNIAMVPQTYASANWWSTTRVLGMTEMYPSGTIPAATTVVLPQGTMLVIPGGATPMVSSMPTVTTTVAGTTETTTTVPPATTTTTTTTVVPTTTMPEANEEGTTTTPTTPDAGTGY